MVGTKVRYNDSFANPDVPSSREKKPPKKCVEAAWNWSMPTVQARAWVGILDSIQKKKKKKNSQRPWSSARFCTREDNVLLDVRPLLCFAFTLD